MPDHCEVLNLKPANPIGVLPAKWGGAILSRGPKSVKWGTQKPTTRQLLTAT